MAPGCVPASLLICTTSARIVGKPAVRLRVLASKLGLLPDLGVQEEDIVEQARLTRVLRGRANDREPLLPGDRRGNISPFVADLQRKARSDWESNALSRFRRPSTYPKLGAHDVSFELCSVEPDTEPTCPLDTMIQFVLVLAGPSVC